MGGRSTDFPRHNDFIENGQRKGMFLGYDVAPTEVRFTSQEIFCNGRIWGEQKREQKKNGDLEVGFFVFSPKFNLQWTLPYVVFRANFFFRA